jgi:hypothetical protein
MRFPSDEFDAAVAATCHGTASEELLAELTAVLRDEPAALDEYLWQKEIHSRLATGHEFFVHDLLRAEDAGAAHDEVVAGQDNTARTGLSIGRLSIGRTTAVLAGVVLAATVLAYPNWLSKWGVDARPAPAVTSSPAMVRPVVARLAELDGVGWVGADVAHEVGDAIRAGETFALATGRLRIDFLCGASVWLTAPAIFEMESRQSARLTAGRVQVIASTPEAKGFTIHTRTASIVDLGTEFTAEATLDGRCRVGVTSGEVQVHLAAGAEASGPARHLLKAGDVIAVEPGPAQVTARIESGDDSPAFRFPSIEPPSAGDDADISRGKATIRCVRGHLYKGRKAQSGQPEIMLDGKGQSKPDAPAESVYFTDNEIGGLLLDLGGPVSVAKINVYSWHLCMNEGFSDPLRAAHRERAAQNYVLYGFAGDEPPERGESPAESGWTLIAQVNSDDYFGLSGVQRPAQQASSISSARGSLGRFRHLLWIVQPTSGRNHDGSDLSFSTFFGEIDVYAAE